MGNCGVFTWVYALSHRKGKQFCLLNKACSDLIIWVSNVDWTWLAYKDMWAVMVFFILKGKIMLQFGL